MATVQVSEQQVVQAEARAREAAESREAAARRLEASPYSDVAALEHSEAARMAAQLQANAREMRETHAHQVEEERRRASRPELEKAAAAEIRAAGQEMDAARKALVKAAVEAQAALVVLADAGVSYNEGLARHVQVLSAAGLDFFGESGGERSVLGVDRLKVKGEEFHPVAPGSVAVWLVRRVVEARLSPLHHLVSALEWLWRSVNLDSPEMGRLVPEPPAKKFPKPLRLRMPQG
ncbi:hypothetical protein ABZ490_40190 [Streptomyces sp. NPDC005811]|uniref:hypothetical protein n=1 Tax=Streptomyces sp. NPDC005811 TaxID=3154565 RepID=UPI0033D55ECB